MARQEYKRMAYRTVKDIEAAEKLQADGWRVITVGGTSILLEREVQS